MSITIAKMTARTTNTGVSNSRTALMTLLADNIRSSVEMASARAVPVLKKLPRMERIVKQFKRNAVTGREDNQMVNVKQISATTMKRKT